jgi:hypothetical protein
MNLMGKLTTRRLLFISLGLLLIDLSLAVILFNLDDSTYQNLDGTAIEAHSVGLIRTVISGLVISIPILCFLVGLLVAIFIDRNRPYSERIVKAFLLTLTVVYALYAAMGVTRIVIFS